MSNRQVKDSPRTLDDVYEERRLRRRIRRVIAATGHERVCTALCVSRPTIYRFLAGVTVRKATRQLMTFGLEGLEKVLREKEAS